MNKRIIKLLFAATISSPLFLLSRDRPSHEITGPIANEFSQENNGVRATIEQCNINNTTLFSKKRIFKTHQVLKLTIHNQTDRVKRITSRSLNLPLEKPKKIARKFQYNPLLAVFWPWSSMSATKAYAMIFFNIFGILGVTIHDNKRMHQQFETYATSLSHDIYIPPHRSLSRYIYVKNQHYRPSFLFSVFDDASKTTFNVELGAPVLI